MKTKKIQTKKNIDTSKYVNIETGELLSTEEPHISSFNNDDKDYVIMDYEKYTVVDHKVISFLNEVLPPQELGRIMAISTSLEQRTNVLMTDKEPHTDKTLSVAVDYTSNKYRDFMNKMYKASIVYKLNGYWNGKERTMFILNPHLARVSKTIRKDLIPLFENLSTKSGQNIVKKALNIPLY